MLFMVGYIENNRECNETILMLRQIWSFKRIIVAIKKIFKYPQGKIEFIDDDEFLTSQLCSRCKTKNSPNDYY
jgi:transposase